MTITSLPAGAANYPPPSRASRSVFQIRAPLVVVSTQKVSQPRLCASRPAYDLGEDRKLHVLERGAGAPDAHPGEGAVIGMGIYPARNLLLSPSSELASASDGIRSLRRNSLLGEVDPPRRRPVSGQGR